MPTKEPVHVVGNAIIEGAHMGFMPGRGPDVFTVALTIDVGDGTQVYSMSWTSDGSHTLFDSMVRLLQITGVKEWADVVGKPIRVHRYGINANDYRIMGLGHFLKKMWLGDVPEGEDE